jgi:hypothetical protein
MTEIPHSGTGSRGGYIHGFPLFGPLAPASRRPIEREAVQINGLISVEFG